MVEDKEAGARRELISEAATRGQCRPVRDLLNNVRGPYKSAAASLFDCCAYEAMNLTIMGGRGDKWRLLGF
jgi:hypothetical protein